MKILALGVRQINLVLESGVYWSSNTRIVLLFLSFKVDLKLGEILNLWKESE